MFKCEVCGLSWYRAEGLSRHACHGKPEPITDREVLLIKEIAKEFIKKLREDLQDGKDGK